MDQIDEFFLAVRPVSSLNAVSEIRERNNGNTWTPSPSHNVSVVVFSCCKASKGAKDVEDWLIRFSVCLAKNPLSESAWSELPSCVQQAFRQEAEMQIERRESPSFQQLQGRRSGELHAEGWRWWFIQRYLRSQSCYGARRWNERELPWEFHH
jgi:hypothetical protein